MRQIVFLALLALNASLNSAQQPHFSDLEHTAEANQWIEDTLVSIQTIHVGMTRDDLEKRFTIEGGFHGGPLSRQVYEYKQCGFIKVEVEFNHLLRLATEDKITRISRPYLEKPSHAAD